MNNKIYLTIIVDRHEDIAIEAYYNKEAAIKRALIFLKEYGDEEYIENEEIEGYLFFSYYTCENDYIYVVEKEIHE